MSDKSRLKTMRKIAKSGLKGRKKDTFLLVFVVTLAFTFIISAILLHSSSEKTKHEQRFDMFGQWQAALFNLDPHEYDQVLEEESIGLTRYIGKSDNFGHLMTFNEEILELGNFKLIEGHMPTNLDEITLELNQQIYFRNDVKVGDQVDIVVQIPVFEMNELEEAEAYATLQERYIESLEINDEFYKEYYEENKDYLEHIYEIDKEYLEAQFPDIEDEDEKYKLIMKELIDMNAFYISYNIRNEHEVESYGGTQVITKTSYLFHSDGAYEKEGQQVDENIEWIKENGIMFSQEVVISRPMEVSGIIETYSNLWDVGDSPVANSFISEETGRALLEGGFFKTEYENLAIDISNYKAPLNIFINTNMDTDKLMETYSETYPNLKRNTYAYPQVQGSTEGTLTYSIVAFVFVATVFAVFQIYLTQMRRRTRKLALLKSIGATNGQIVQMIVWEGIYLLLISLPIGAIAGLSLTNIIIFIMNRNDITNIMFAINYKILGLGILAGILAVVIGMVVPMIMAINVPLTGRISKPPKHKKSTLKLKANIKNKDIYEAKKQSFFNISIRSIVFNKGKYLITLVLYTVAITVLISTIFLSYLFFKDYINDVILVDKPNYGYEMIYGMSNRVLKEVEEEIENVPGVTDVKTYKAGEGAFMWYEDIYDHELYPVFKNVLPNYLIKDHFGEGNDDIEVDDSVEYLIEDSVKVNVYGFDVESKDSIMLQTLENNISEGGIDKEKFANGEDVVVLMPLYDINPDVEIKRINDQTIINNTNSKNRMEALGNYLDAYDITYDFRHKDTYDRDSSLSPGDYIYVSVPTESIEEGEMVEDVITHKVKVSGVIHYFPEIGMWPLADTIENPVIIGSNYLVGSFYPSTIYGPGRNLEVDNVQALIDSLFPTKLGKTYIYIETDKEAKSIDTFIELQRIAVDRGFSFINYQENIDAIFAKAFNFTSIIAVLGLVIAGIALVILYNTTLSKVEQERNRIGILQSLGISTGQFKLLYLLTGFISSIIALIIGHAILAIIVYFTMDYGLYLYPWKLHISVCVAFIILASLVYYIPIRKVIRNQPVDNIRSLTR